MVSSSHDATPEGAPPASRPGSAASSGSRGWRLSLLALLAGLLVLVMMLQQWLAGVGIVRPFGA